MNQQDPLAKEERPEAILGVPAGADAEQIRLAYLEKVKAFPPDRAPEEFERIRNAYDQLRDPRRQARRILEEGNPRAPFNTLLSDQQTGRRFTGPQPWLKLIKE